MAQFVRVFIFFGLLVFIILFFQATNSDNTLVLKDSIEYNHASENIIENFSIYAGPSAHLEKFDGQIDFRLLSKRPPGYPLFLAQSMYKPAILFAQFLLSILMYFIGLAVLKHFEDSTRTYLVFSVLFWTSLSIFFYVHFEMADLILGVLISLMLYLFIKKEYNMLGIIWAIALLVKPVLVPSVFIALVLYVYLWISKKSLRPKAYGTLLLPVLFFTLISVNNKQSTGKFEYSSISTINMINYNAKLAIAKTYGQDSANAFVSGSEFNIPSSKQAYIQYSETLNEKAKAALSSNKLSYLKVHLLGTIKMFIDPGRFELYSFFGKNNQEISLTELLFSGNTQEIKRLLKQDRVLFGVFLSFFALALMKFILFLLGSITKDKTLITCLFVVLYFVALTGPIGASRFLLAAIVPYLILSSVGLEKGLNFFKKGSKP